MVLFTVCLAQDPPTKAPDTASTREEAPIRDTSTKTEPSIKAMEKFKTPQTFREYYINNLIDETHRVAKSEELSKSLGRDGHKEFHGDLVGLVCAEKDNNKLLSLVSRHEEKLNSIIKKFGKEKAKTMLIPATQKLIDDYGDTNDLKEIGADAEFRTIIKNSVFKAIDAVKE